ncbi:MAG: tetratricopeptide repeat protein [Lewinellaceae bacterium]|nr:tetratricopeptide repeat protein [Lewinellaceae bacterium]
MGKNKGVDKAEKAGIESIDIYRKLADKNPDAFLKTLAFHLSYLAEFYRRHKINDKAEKFYIESVDILREIAGKNPDDHLLRLARTLSDLGQFYEKNSQKAQAEKAYREAFDLYPKLDVKQLGWYDAGNLFEISKFFSPEDPLTTEKACRGAVNIYRNLEEQNPGEYTEDLISMLTNLGIFYMANGKSEDAEKVHYEAFSLYRKSHEGITDTFLTDLAYQLREFGYGYEEAQQYGPALKCYHKGLVTCHTNAKVKSDDFYFEWERLVSRVFEIQNKSFDSAQYDIAIRAALVLAESMDSMQRFDAQFKAVVVSEYVSLSWYYLFVRQYKESAYYAEKARSLDPAQNLARTNLGHSYLYRNDWKRAQQIYEEYLKNEKDLSEAKNILLKDWDDLEKAGLTHKSLVKAREWLNRQ